MDAINQASGLHFTFEKRGCRKLLQKHNTLELSVSDTITRQADHDFFKTKYASRQKWNGLPILECRVNDPSAGSVRVAFTREGTRICVIYLTRTLLKKAFTQELESFLKGAGA